MLLATRAPGNPALTVHFPHSLPLKQIAPQTRKNPMLMLAIALDWVEFEKEVEALAESEDDGFIIEDFVGVYQRFLRLVDAGVRFAPYFRGWLDGLRDSIRGTGADSDDDVDYADFENEDPDEDASDRHLIEHEPSCDDEWLGDMCCREDSDDSREETTAAVVG